MLGDRFMMRRIEGSFAYTTKPNAVLSDPNASRRWDEDVERRVDLAGKRHEVEHSHNPHFLVVVVPNADGSVSLIAVTSQTPWREYALDPSQMYVSTQDELITVMNNFATPNPVELLPGEGELEMNRP